MSSLKISYVLSKVIMVRHKVCVFIYTFFILPTDDKDVTSVNNALLKQGYAVLVTLILEAIKLDSDLSTIM